MRMRTKLAPWVRAVIVIAALLIGQVQIAFAADVSDVPVEYEQARVPEAGDNPPGDVLGFPNNDRDECKVRISHYLLASPFTGVPDPGLPNHGADVLQTETAPYATAKPGDELEWLIVIMNDTAAAGCGPTGDEMLSAVRFEYEFRDTGGVMAPIEGSYPLQFDPGPPDTLPNQGSLAWQVYTFTVPNNVSGLLQARAAVRAEAENNPDPGPNPPNDVIDFGATDYVNIEGPGFEIVNFITDPNDLLEPDYVAAAGQPVEFLIHIRNTRPGSTIRQILVDSASAGFVSSCGGITNWTLYPGGTPLNGTTGLLSGEEAQCLATALIPADPAPDTYRLAGDVTVSEDEAGGNPLDMTLHAISNPAVDVLLPAVAIQKRVLNVRRGATTIWPTIPPTDPLVIPGDIVTYQIDIYNTGDVTLTHLWVVDSLTGPIFISPSVTLPPGPDPYTVTTQYPVPQNSPDPLQNTVTVTADASGYTPVNAQAIASVDVADSALTIELIAEDPGTGLEVNAAEIGQQIRYRLRVHNNGLETLENLTQVALPLPLQTVGSPPNPLIPNAIPAGGILEWTWLYTIQPDDKDPLVSTFKLRGQMLSGALLYAQDQATVDITNPDIGISVDVVEPDTATVLRGQTVIYNIEVQNKDAVTGLCDVVVRQIRRDPTTGLEFVVQGSVPMVWPTATPGVLPGGSGPATATVSYLVTGQDIDPLDMVFEVTALDACPGGNEYIDRTSSVLDISDAQVNTVLDPVFPGPDEVAVVGEWLEFQYIVTNVGAVTLEGLSATFCILHGVNPVAGKCDLPFNLTPLVPLSIGSFEDAQGSFQYLVTAEDAEAVPFAVEVTLTGTDNRGNTVSIKTAVNVAVATNNVQFLVTGPAEAVIGDTITFNYSFLNVSGVPMADVYVYNMLMDPPEEVGYFAEVEVDGYRDGSFDYPIAPNVGIADDVLTMVARLEGDTSAGPVLATDTHEVELIPQVDVEKTGDTSRVAGQSVHYRVTITNRSVSQTLSNITYDDAVLEGYGIIPTHADFETWSGTPGVLQPLESVTAEFMIPGPPEVPAASGVDPAPSPLVNVFVATGVRSYDNATVSGQDDHSVTIDCPVDFNFQITNLDDEPEDILGETLRWEISFTNISLDTINNLTIEESLNWNGLVPAGEITWPGTPGTLEPGATAFLNAFDVLITGEYGEDNPVSSTVVGNFAEVGGASLCMEQEARNVYSPVQPYKIPDPFVAFTGETVDYLLGMVNLAETNDGIYQRYFVTGYDSLLTPNPIPFEYVVGNPTTSGWLEADQEVMTVLSRTVLETDPDKLTNIFTVEFPDPGDPDRILFAFAEATVFTGNPLSLTKTPSATVSTAGSPISYDYSVTNVSPYTVTGITLEDDRIGNLTPMVGGPFTLEPGETVILLDVNDIIPLNAEDPYINTFTATGTVVLDDPPEERLISNSITAKVDLLPPEVTISKWAALDAAGTIPVEDVDPADGVPEVPSGTPVYYCFIVANSLPEPAVPFTGPFVEDIQIQDSLFLGDLQPLFEAQVVGNLGHPNTPEERDKLYGGEAVQFCYGPIVLQSGAGYGDPVVNNVTLLGTTNDGTSVFHTDQFIVDILGTDLRVTKTPSQPVAFVGDDIYYTIRLLNYNGSHEIIVDPDGVVDTFINGAPITIPLEMFDWSNSGVPGNPVGRLGPAQPQPRVATYTYVYHVAPADPDPLENTVTARGVLDDNVNPPDRTPVEDGTRAVVAVTASQLVVRKTATPNVSAVSADNCGTGAGTPNCRTVRYTISITNIGTSTVHDVTAMDQHLDVSTGAMVQQWFTGGDLTDTVLDPYETAYIYYDLVMPTAAQLLANPELDPFINVITAYGVVFDGNGEIIPLPPELAEPNDPADISVKGWATATVDLINPDLRAVKSPELMAAAPGQLVIYTILITNTGTDTLDEIFVEDVTGGITLDLDADCATGNPLTCLFRYQTDDELYDPITRKLPPGQALYGSITIPVPNDLPGNEFTNIVEIRATTDLGDPVIDRTSATIDVRDDGLLVEKFASPNDAPVGTTVTYTVRITNIGVNAMNRLDIADLAMDGIPSHMVTVETFPDGDNDLFEPAEEYVLQYPHQLTVDDGEIYINRVSVTGYTVNGLALLSMAEAIVDVQQAEVTIEKFVCAGTYGGAPYTLPEPCETVVNIGDAVEPDTVTYFLHIYNPSPTVGIEELAVQDNVGTLPAITWPMPNDGLAPDDGVADGGDDEVWVTYTYDIQPGDLTPLDNLAIVTGVAEGDVDVQDSATARLRLVTGDLMVTKDAPDEAAVGQTVTYTLRVEHLGTIADPIEDIDVVDPRSPFGGSPIPACHVVTLAANDWYECTFDYTVTAFDNSPVYNTATATGEQAGVAVSSTDTHALTIPTPGLAITKTVNTPFAAIGETVTFTYVLTNTGTSAISNLVVTDTDPVIVFNEGPWPTSLSVGQTAIRTADRVMTAVDPDPYSNTVTAAGLVAGLPIEASATATVYIANGNLVVSNTPSVPFAVPGQVVTFTYMVTNLGADTITGLEITDNLCGFNGDSLPDLESGVSLTVFCDAVAALPGPLTANVFVEGVEPGLVTVNDTATAEVPVTQGGVLITKTAAPLVVGTTTPDNVITYTIEVTNVGNEPLLLAPDAVVDSLGIILTPAPPSVLAVGESFTMSGTYVAGAGDIPTVANTVTVTAEGQTTGTIYTDTDSASVAVVADPGAAVLTLTKEVSAATVLPGDRLTYTFTVRNVSAATTATGVVLNDPYLGTFGDPVVPGGTVDLPDLGPGNVITRTFDVIVPPNWVDLDFTNSAQVTADPDVSASANVTVDVELLTLEKTADPGPYLPEQPVTYTFTVTNHSTAELSTLTLDDPLIDGPDGTWTTPLPVIVAGSGVVTATGVYTIPAGYALPTVDNTATLLLNGVAAATDTLSVPVVSAGLAVTILDVAQYEEDEAEIETRLDIARTGHEVQVTFEVHNPGLETVTNLAYEVDTSIPGVDCDLETGTLDDLAAGETRELMCTFIPPFGNDPDAGTAYEGASANFPMTRDVIVTVTGDAGGEALEDVDADIFRLVDLVLEVNLAVAPQPGVAGADVAFTLTITNAGYTTIGCDETVADDAPCHMRFEGGDDGDGTFLDTVFADLVGVTNDLQDEVLLPGDDIVFLETYTVEADDVSLMLSARVYGGFFNTAVPIPANLDGLYVVWGADNDVPFVVGGAEITARIEVNPNPPVPGQTVTYTVYVRNTGAVNVNTLTGTWSIYPHAVANPNDTVMTAGAHEAAWLQGTKTGPLTFNFSPPLLPYNTVVAEAVATVSMIEEYTGPYQFQVGIEANGGTAQAVTTSQFLDVIPYGAAAGTVTPTVDPATLDPTATTPRLTKEANAEVGQIGGTVVWTITVRNSWTQIMPNVTIQDNVPGTLEVVSATTDRGASVVEGQLVTVSTGSLNPGDVVTVTITTTVLPEAGSPGTVTNTACAMQVGGDAQDCGSATVNLGPDVGTLPATGVATPTDSGGGALPVGLLSLGLVVGLLALMGAANPNRRGLMAVLFVVVALAIVAVAVVVAVMSGSDDADEPAGDANAGGGDALDPTLGADIAPTTGPAGDGEIVMQFPPTATPYVVPTRAGVRRLMIPKLDAQFDVPVQIVNVPLKDREWDVSGLGDYVGWLEGTTWMDDHWGNTVLAAHVQLGPEHKGPFWGLRDLVPGDEIIVIEGDFEWVFEVQSVVPVDPDFWQAAAPTNEPTLTLITCTNWDRNYGVFSQRLVVRAVPSGGAG